MKVRLISYNVNGLRAAIQKGFYEWLAICKPDIICLQEIKVFAEQIDKSRLESMGYHHFWFPAKKPGYSGTALFTRLQPENVFYGMGIEKFDMEGRLIRTDFNGLTHLTVYFPSGTSGEERQAFKMEFLKDFTLYTKELLISRPKLIISGDLNIAHTPIDINHPERHQNSSGFLPEEREWMDQFLAINFLDTFRSFNSEPNQYSWWTYRAQAREKNLGWRIDYHLASLAMKPHLLGAAIFDDVRHSDHCPVTVDFDL